ncbi:hypothetical protein VMCG_06061 [Cytospora schulzeri]|uniref:Uncharacterized protein n=1 Tax=Cytospora schulzeri TaxID=448051 RepID=A0A423WGJ3_9PEZI|nr:hypothetical protein VMCG_06061 [Valsa malicola]
MKRMWTQMRKQFQKAKSPSSAVKLVDRTTCPAFLSLKKLTDDPELHRHIKSHARQLMLDLELPVPNARGDVCRCPDRTHREKNAFRLGRRVAANDDGWQDALAQALVGYIVSHLSAGIDARVHRAIEDTVLDWVGFCPNHLSRSSPVGVVEAVCRSIEARLSGERESLQRCAVLGALLNIVTGRMRRACDEFREDVDFPEHVWRHDEKVVGAFEVYLRDPSREAFEVAVGDLELGLSERRLCVCGKH